MQGLFNPARHEPLTSTVWSADAAHAAVGRIAAAADQEMEPAPRWCWPTHPRDDSQNADDRRFNLYWGSGGVLWALRHLAGQGAVSLKTDFSPLVDGVVERNRVLLEGDTEGTASYLFGDAGLLLLQWQRVLCRRVYEAVWLQWWSLQLRLVHLPPG